MKILPAAILLATGLAIGGALAGPAMAQSAGEHAGHHAAADPAAASYLTDGEVRKVDKEAGKLTIKHGAIKNLDMPGMTMLFQVKDPAMLDMVKPGDKVKFRAEKAGGGIVVTEIQVTK